MEFSIRVRAAVREHDDWYESNQQGMEYDSHFDGGEFSGPAWAKMIAKHQRKCCVKWRITEDDFWGEQCRQMYGDDPMGVWHGRNE